MSCSPLFAQLFQLGQQRIVQAHKWPYLSENMAQILILNPAPLGCLRLPQRREVSVAENSEIGHISGSVASSSSMIIRRRASLLSTGDATFASVFFGGSRDGCDCGSCFFSAGR